MKTGIYCIRNKINTKVYIGSAAVSFAHRFRVHRMNLCRGTHHNRHLQASWAKYGESSFEFIEIEQCLPEDCLILEQYWIDYYDATNPSAGYNLSPTAGSTLGVKFSDDAKAKLSEVGKKQKGRKHTPEHNANSITVQRTYTSRRFTCLPTISRTNSCDCCDGSRTVRCSAGCRVISAWTNFVCSICPTT